MHYTLERGEDINPHTHTWPIMSLFGKLVARSRQSASAALLSRSSCGYLGSVSFSSSAPAALTKQPTKSNEYGGSIIPATFKRQQPVTENLKWRTALLQQQKDDINNLEKIMDSLRIARIPPPQPPISNTTPTTQQQQHTFQVMNRNARKAKRANHGKRPCSRIRRRYKVKKW